MPTITFVEVADDGTMDIETNQGCVGRVRPAADGNGYVLLTALFQAAFVVVGTLTEARRLLTAALEARR